MSKHARTWKSKGVLFVALTKTGLLLADTNILLGPPDGGGQAFAVSFTSSHTALLLKNNLGSLVFCSFLFSLEPMEGSREAQDRLRMLGLAAFVDTLREGALQLVSMVAPWAEVLNVRRKGWQSYLKFGEKVRELRKQQRMSQQELADRAGIDFTYLSKIENSRMWTPSEKVIHRVAKGLDADADELLVLADKFPSDLAQQLKTPERIKALRRELAGDYNSVEAFRRAFG